MRSRQESFESLEDLLGFERSTVNDYADYAYSPGPPEPGEWPYFGLGRSESELEFETPDSWPGFDP
jgi:hypothetical protein